MPYLTDPQRDEEHPGRLSRAEIECACLLHAVGSSGGTIRDLTARLGLSQSLASAVEKAIIPLVQAGHLEWNQDQLMLTNAGSNRLQAATLA